MHETVRVRQSLGLEGNQLLWTSEDETERAIAHARHDEATTWHRDRTGRADRHGARSAAWQQITRAQMDNARRAALGEEDNYGRRAAHAGAYPSSYVGRVDSYAADWSELTDTIVPDRKRDVDALTREADRLIRAACRCERDGRKILRRCEWCSLIGPRVDVLDRWTLRTEVAPDAITRRRPPSAHRKCLVCKRTDDGTLVKRCPKCEIRVGSHTQFATPRLIERNGQSVELYVTIVRHPSGRRVRFIGCDGRGARVFAVDAAGIATERAAWQGHRENVTPARKARTGRGRGAPGVKRVPLSRTIAASRRTAARRWATAGTDTRAMAELLETMLVTSERGRLLPLTDGSMLICHEATARVTHGATTVEHTHREMSRRLALSGITLTD